MLKFAYRVRDSQGRLLTGVVEAENRNILITSFLKQKYLIISIEEDKLTGREIKLDFSRGKVPLHDLAAMTRQWSTMLAAGIAVFHSLTILERQTANKNLKQSLGQVQSDIEKGQALSQALKQHPRVFSSIYVSMVHAGESSGTLALVLDRLSRHLEREQIINAKLTSASVYPVAIIIFTLIVIVFIITFIMPSFMEMFESAGARLPLPTQILIGLGARFKTSGVYILGGVIIMVYLLKRWGQTTKGRLFFDGLYLRLPLLGTSISRVIIARFTRTMGTLSQSGVPVLEALAVVEEVVGNRVMAQAINRARVGISEGGSISVPLQNTKIFDPMLIQMIAVGEETGELGDMLIRMSDHLEQESLYSIDAMVSLVEPLLIIAVAVIIGGIVVATLLPTFELINTIGLSLCQIIGGAG